jgi:hypothetical protein
MGLVCTQGTINRGGVYQVLKEDHRVVLHQGGRLGGANKCPTKGVNKGAWARRLV